MDKVQEKFFDEWAKEYFLNKVPQYQKMVDHMFDQTADILKKGKEKELTIMDLGTGTGILAMYADSLFSVKKMVAVDVSQEMLDVVKRRWEDAGKNLRKLATMKANFEELSIEQKSYDMIMASFSLHHIKHEDKGAMIKKIADGLKPGGIFLLGETMFESQSHPLKIMSVYVRKAVNGLLRVGFAQFMREVDFCKKIINKEGEYMATKEMWESCIQEVGLTILESKFTAPWLTYGFVIARKNE